MAGRASCSRAAASSGSARQDAKVRRAGRPRGEVDGSSRSPTTPSRSSSASTQLTDPASGVLAIGLRAGGDRLQGGPRQGHDRRAARRRAGAGRRWRRTPTSPRPTTRRTSRRCGCSARELPRDPAGGRVRDGVPRDDPRGQRALRRARWSGRRSTASSAGASTAPAIATSPGGRPSCWATRRPRIISCHLGGSSSLCAIRGGKSVAQQPGHEPADRACRTTTASATSTCSPCRSLMRGDRARRWSRCSTTWRTGRACWA